LLKNLAVSFLLASNRVQETDSILS
jgi:hypothetical protein